MGEGDHRKASKYFKIVALFSTILDILLAITIYFCREGLSRIYTNQDELIPMIKDAYVVMIYILLLHGFAMV